MVRLVHAAGRRAAQVLRVEHQRLLSAQVVDRAVGVGVRGGVDERAHLQHHTPGRIVGQLVRLRVVCLQHDLAVDQLAVVDAKAVLD